MTQFLIIGAGECGVRAAFALREQGFTGAITLLGNESALPYERPPLSKSRDAEPRAIRSEAAYADAKIDLRLGSSVKAIDRASRKVVLEEGDTLPYDKLLLTMGSRARLFPGLDGCLTLRSDEDAKRIMSYLAAGARVGIIGGGFIGLELAATARMAGATVTVVEAAPRVLGRAVPMQIASIVHARHCTEGVEVITGMGVSSANASSITLADGTRLEFDIVVAGVGAIPNTELAEAAGLEVDNGITVDLSFGTSDPNVFAAGDCCNFEWRGNRVRLESWTAAQNQGAHAAAALLGATDKYNSVPWFWSDQYDLTLNVTGIFDSSATIHRRDTSDSHCIVFQCDPSGHLSAAAGIGSGNAVTKELRIFERLIGRKTVVVPGRLIDSTFNLKQLLKAA